MTVLICEIHDGPLHRRDDGMWTCPGWDGEGYLNVRSGIPDEAAARLLAGETRWPGVQRNIGPWP